MARITPIRITQNDRKEYARLVRNTRSKIRRTEKNYGIDISNEVKLPDSIDEFKTRKDFNKWKQDMSSFTNRANTNYQFVKNEYGVVASKKQIYKIEQDTKDAQRRAKQEIKKHMNKPVMHKGKQILTVEQRTLHMSVPKVTGISVPKDFDFKNVRNQQRLKDIEESMDKRKEPEYFDWKKEQMKLNFMSMLEQAFNSDSDELVNMIGDIHPDDFYDLYLQQPEMFHFDYFYQNEVMDDALQNDLNDLNKMQSFVESYVNGEVDKDLKNF